MGIGYHPANLKYQPFPHWKVKLMARIGVLIGVQFKIGGIPYGAPYDREAWEKIDGPRDSGSASTEALQGANT